MNQIDPRIIEAVVRPEGVTEAELEEINSQFRAHLDALRHNGMHLFEKTIDGQITYSTVELATVAMPAPAPSTAAPPPAEAPRAWGQPDTAPEEADGELGYDARFTIDTFKAFTREGRAPKIEMIPTGPIGAQVATLFSMQKPKKAIVMVYLKIISEEMPTEKQEPQRPPYPGAPAGSKEITPEAPATQEGGEEDMVAPKDYSTIQINSKGKSNEKRPKAKPKEQIAREIEEQISKGELSPAAADAMSKLGGL